MTHPLILLNEINYHLIERIMAFELDDSCAHLPFTARLAREQGWTHVFAGRVVTEYKRFVVLAMLAGHPVTPSEEVDQVWHLHLVYTRSYWQGLCRDVLGRELHHGRHPDHVPRLDRGRGGRLAHRGPERQGRGRVPGRDDGHRLQPVHRRRRRDD